MDSLQNRLERQEDLGCLARLGFLDFLVDLGCLARLGFLDFLVDLGCLARLDFLVDLGCLADQGVLALQLVLEALLLARLASVLRLKPVLAPPVLASLDHNL